MKKILSISSLLCFSLFCMVESKATNNDAERIRNSVETFLPKDDATLMKKLHGINRIEKKAAYWPVKRSGESTLKSERRKHGPWIENNNFIYKESDDRARQMLNTFLFPFDGDITSENLQKKLELLNQFDEICSYFANEVIIGDKMITEDGQTVYVFRPLPLIDIDSYFTDKANGKQRELLYVSYPGACCPLRPEKFSSLRNVNLNTAQTIEAFPLITDPDANAGVIQRATADTDYLAGATAAQNAQTFETAVNAFTPIWWKELITKKENLKQFQEDIISFEDVLAEDDIAELGLIYSTHCMRKFLPMDANDKPLDNKDCLYSFRFKSRLEREFFEM